MLESTSGRLLMRDELRPASKGSSQTASLRICGVKSESSAPARQEGCSLPPSPSHRPIRGEGEAKAKAGGKAEARAWKAPLEPKKTSASSRSFPDGFSRKPKGRRCQPLTGPTISGSAIADRARANMQTHQARFGSAQTRDQGREPAVRTGNSNVARRCDQAVRPPIPKVRPG
jgi:hypothetical protein